ncbi:MAG: transglutaminase-like domain-containing protein [Nitrospirota bacterium]
MAKRILSYKTGFWFFFSFFLIVAILFAIFFYLEVSYKVGINYYVHEKKIPLFNKLVHFVSRDLQYKEIIGEILKPDMDDKDKIMAIYKWTIDNTRLHPPNMPVVDDHVAHVIIRGYGDSDQIADVFATLCAYADIPAFMRFISPKNRKERLGIAFVKHKGKWIVFDPAHRNIFVNSRNEWAGVEEIISDISIVKMAKNQPVVNGLPYSDYFNNLKPVKDIGLTKTEAQMPCKRLKYEVMKFFR